MTFEQAQIMRRLREGSDCHTFDLSGQDLDFLKSEIKMLLHLGPQLVEFKKADGSIRVMNCTLSDLHGAKYTQTPVVENAAKELKTKKPNEDVCAVWDIDAGAWRSFRWDRLIRIDYKLG
jgi:hypothetical protein